MAIIRTISKPVNPLIEKLEAKAAKDWERRKAKFLKDLIIKIKTA